MLRLQKLSKYFLILFCLVSVSLNAAETKWEVAIVFRGDGEDEQFQKDIDDNILELARIIPQKSLRLGIYRESEGRSYSYLPQGSGIKPINLGNILYRQDLNQFKVPGTIRKNSKSDLFGFLKSFYKNETSKKALIIYSHGKGADGFNDLATRELKETLGSLPHLDLLWLDACFMANMEFLYEIRSYSDYTIASEEAEFASGLPFQTLSLLPNLTTPKQASISLAKNFIDSYSYLKNGKQRNYVRVSSATVSVIENKKIEVLANSLKSVSTIIKKLNTDQKNKLIKILSSKAVMDDKSLVDLGILLIELRKLNSDKATDKSLSKLIQLLNIEAVKMLKSNPRVYIKSPSPSNESLMVYGFNSWKDGTSDDFQENDIFDQIIKHDGFVDGPREFKWPFIKTSSEDLAINPFAPGINTFNYYFINAKTKKPLSSTMRFSRTHDVAESVADSETTPLVYTAYTQQIGTKAERYTGINITMPESVPSMDYYELEFNQLAKWLSL